MTMNWLRKRTRYHLPRGLQPHAWVMTRFVRPWLRSLARLKVFNVTVVNSAAVPAKGRAIIACNHLSIADPVVLWGAVRRNATAIAAAELWKVPGLNLLLSLLGHIPVIRGNLASGNKVVESGRLILEHDGILFIYPEGKCSKDGELLPFKGGVADMAIATGAPIIPAGILGTNTVKPLGTWRINRRHPVTLRFGTPIDPADYTGPDAKRRILADLREQVAALSAT